ncbi:hypothetical protein K5Y32_22135 [Pantoea sp. DY-15]|uniref:hypothetical protein n=1 Tax=Pantoea sp. DY-15 TaxID=2871489 RepID=UPI001C986B77|nr:hypothetical protein [Pantoea sp. DY-15]MBY4890636.1 hypothetical protein [Pantoea sp. DY-15]
MEWPEEFCKRGQDIREEAFKQFEVRAVTKTTLLPNQRRFAYHGQLLDNEYYYFIFTDRKTGEEGSFYCGGTAADGWLSINGQKSSDIMSYNPLNVASQTSSTSGGRSQTNPSIVLNKDDLKRKKLIHILQTFIALTDNTQDDSTVIKLLHKHINLRTVPLDIGHVRGVNTTFASIFKNGRLKDYFYSRTYTQFVVRSGIPIKPIDVKEFNDLIITTANDSKIHPYTKPASF